MNSYIEVTFINNVLLMLISVMLAHYLMIVSMKKSTMFYYAITISLLSILLWDDDAFIIMLIVEGLACVFWFRLQFKVYVLAYSIRYLLSLTCYVCYGGSFHLMIYFVPAHTYTILYFWVIGFLFLFACMRKWKYFISQTQYIHEVTLWNHKKKWRMYGYLDSGNLLSYHQIPIIFVLSKYYEYFKNENIELVVMNTMNETSSIRVYPGEIQMKGCAKKAVYICFEWRTQIPMHCECLLNLNVLTR